MTFTSFQNNILLKWLAVLEFNATFTATVISWQLVTHTFLGFLTPVLTQLFFPKPPTTFLTWFCRGERRKYTRKKFRLNRGSNSQPPGHQVMSPTRTPLSHPDGAIFFSSHWLLSHMNAWMASGKRGMNSVAISIINPQKNLAKLEIEPLTSCLQSRVNIHQPFLRRLLLFLFPNVYCIWNQLKFPLANPFWFSQSEVVLISHLQISGELDKDCSSE